MRLLLFGVLGLLSLSLVVGGVEAPPSDGLARDDGAESELVALRGRGIGASSETAAAEASADEAPAPAPEPVSKWTLRGTVRNPGGSTVPGAYVLVRWEGDTIHRITCDAHGGFSVGLPGIGALSREGRERRSLEVEARAPRYHAIVPRIRTLAGGTVIPANYAEPDHPARVQWQFPTREPLNAALYLEPGPYLEGRVVSRTGEPVVDAAVSVRSVEDEQDALWNFACTDAEGRYRLSVDPDRTYSVRAQSRWWGEGRTEPIAVSRDARELGELVLSSPAYIQGLVEHVRLGPVPDVTFYAYEMRHRNGSTGGVGGYASPPLSCFSGLEEYSSNGFFGRYARSDERGDFLIPVPLRDGDWHVRFSGLSTHVGLRRGKSDVSAGARDVRFRIDGHRVRISMTTPKGEPMKSFAMIACGMSNECQASCGVPEGERAEAYYRKTGVAAPWAENFNVSSHAGRGVIEIWVPHGSRWRFITGVADIVYFIAPHDSLTSDIRIVANR